MQESFVFECPACQQELTLPTQVAGRRGKCPKCEAVITIPTHETTDFDLGDFEVRTGDSTIDLPPNREAAQPPRAEPPSEITDELQRLLEELEGE